MATKITISGACASGKGTIGRSLAQSHDFEFVSVGDLMRAATQGRPAQCKGEEAIMSVATNPGLTEQDLITDWKTNLFGRKHTHFILEGRLGWFCIPDSFKIFFTCPLEVRIERFARREKCSPEEAAERITKRDGGDLRRYQDPVYKIFDYSDPMHYDLVFDTSLHGSPEATVSELERQIGDRTFL